MITGQQLDGARAFSEAQAALRARDFARAEELAQAALDSGLQEPPLYYMLAACAAATGRPDLAVDMAKVGVALDPEPDRAIGELAALLLKVGRPAEAAAAAESIPADLRDRRTREVLGLAYAAAGRPDAARATFRSLLADDPQNPLAGRALRHLAPPPLDRMLDGVAAALKGELAILFARLRQGPASEADLAEALSSAGYRRALVKALVRELAFRTQVGSVPLIRIGPDVVCLDTTTLDASP